MIDLIHWIDSVRGTVWVDLVLNQFIGNIDYFVKSKVKDSTVQSSQWFNFISFYYIKTIFFLYYFVKVIVIIF